MVDLERWIKNIEELRKEILLKALGLSIDKGGSWWLRNYLNLFLYGLILFALIISYLFGWVLSFRVFAFMLLFGVVRFIWRKIKRGWSLLKIYLRTRKLLKQVSGLKRE